MINITALASGSGGNCYKIDNGSSSLLIEAGLPIKKIKKGLNYKLSEIDGVLITHEHKDHSKAVEDLCRVGINCYMSPGTAEVLKIDNHRIKLIKPHSKELNKSHKKIGNWVVKGFHVVHDAEEPLGFLIWNKETKDKLAYITDTMYSKARFKGLNYLMVEANYSKDILDKNIKNGRVPAVQKKRLLKNHMALETVKDMLKANDLSQLKEIWLLHLSDRNSNAEIFKKEVQEIAGVPVYVAGK